ncbi:unnamed protein product [Echinostoma caproni]|uniref:Methylosome subunit pICln n=1 Tax=Echinostoma caproni TaxID=27848 RepID=A0A183ARI3_9TREM|nr:unnamed protein product [Echinostoma caproni]
MRSQEASLCGEEADNMWFWYTAKTLNASILHDTEDNPHIGDPITENPKHKNDSQEDEEDNDAPESEENLSNKEEDFNDETNEEAAADELEAFEIRMNISSGWLGNATAETDVYSMLNPWCGQILNYLAESGLSSHLINILAYPKLGSLYIYMDVHLIYYMSEDEFKLLPKTEEIVGQLEEFASKYEGLVKLADFGSKDEDETLFPDCVTQPNEDEG